MSRRLKRKRRHASFHVPQEYRATPRTLVRTSFKLFKDNAVANEEPLLFGQSYWDYLTDLVQNKIVKMVHEDFLKEVHLELLGLCRCPNCEELFMNPFESARHLSDGGGCKPNYLESDYDSDFDCESGSDRDRDCDCPHDCEWEWDDWWECLRCGCCGRH